MKLFLNHNSKIVPFFLLFFCISGFLPVIYALANIEFWNHICRKAVTQNHMFKFSSQFFSVVWNKYCNIHSAALSRRQFWCISKLDRSHVIIMIIKILRHRSNKAKFFLENLMWGKLTLYILNLYVVFDILG